MSMPLRWYTQGYARWSCWMTSEELHFILFLRHLWSSKIVIHRHVEERVISQELLVYFCHTAIPTITSCLAQPVYI